MTESLNGAEGSARRIDLRFDDNRLVPLLYGEHDATLGRIEKSLGVTMISRGNTLTIAGTDPAVSYAHHAIDSLWQMIQKGQHLDAGAVDAAIRFAQNPELRQGEGANGPTIKTRRRSITARTPTQVKYLEALERDALCFGLGPAGTGKTYLAVAHGVQLLQSGAVERLVLSRPAVEAGERLGFLPGDLRDKVDPYLRPIYDALHDMLPPDFVTKGMASGQIEVAPLAFMRGRTLSDAFVILDEAQNTTVMQMKMALTRLGEGSRFVVTGDLSQIDLPTGTRSGLADALDVLAGVEGISFIHFDQNDVVRHPLVGRIVKAYDSRDARRRGEMLGR